MKALFLVVLLSSAVGVAGEFQTGCEKGATEVLCVGHQDCKIGSIMERSRKGLDTEQSGFDECAQFAKEVQALGISLEAKRTISRLQAKIDALNKEISKDFPFLKVTADFKRLAVEDLVKTASFQDHYKTKDRDRSCIVALSSDEKSQQFEMMYLNPIKTAIYNVGKDDAGKEALKEKIKEIRLGFYTHGGTAWLPETKVVDQVLMVPGVYSKDQTGYAASVQKFIEKYL